ncbi:PREDICTED: uncharacterized protein LOC108551098 [Eufriesea mexicana]|uniref:uncharacterized protein LOC108551098 n=1 Tax=Eufriesea mexicana TaxID=516756 RepID=UPI00083C738E|nr:PREDICTED: uncharacterized protein LOC108551098 [Eufriesea mexicana]
MNNYKWNRNKNTLKKNKQPRSMQQKNKNVHRPLIKPHETEEEAIIRRFHNAQRMARFRARKKKALDEMKKLEIELNRRNITFRTIDSIISVTKVKKFQTHFPMQNSSIVTHSICKENKYSQLLTVIEELGKDIKLTYAGSKISAERLKIGIIKARILIKECLMEAEMNSRK